MRSKGILIALAWPETFCKQAGGWYDPLLNWLGISKNNYYRVGHAAVVLICPKSGEVHYFDFGRYHAPFGHGRVRSKRTDHELQLKTVGQFDHHDNFTNYEEVLHELANKEACHGSGTLHASQYAINFKKAFQKANEMQEHSLIPYGPLLPNGTNCSRFVRSVMKAGGSGYKKAQMHVPLTFSPTPIGNVRLLKHYKKVAPLKKAYHTLPSKKTKDFLSSTLPAPAIPEKLPSTVQWHSGEGGGSWFHIEKHSLGLAVKRYDPEGGLECEGIFHSKEPSDFILSDYSVSHPSHCERITLEGKGKKLTFYVVRR